MIALEDKDMEIVRRDDVSTQPWQVKLQRGIHVLREEDTNEEKIIRFRPEEGVNHVEF